MTSKSQAFFDLTEVGMKRHWPAILALAGLMTVVAGVLYGSIFAGVPYQDPTPEMSATYAWHSGVTSAVRWLGGSAFLIGLVAGSFRGIGRLSRR